MNATIENSLTIGERFSYALKRAKGIPIATSLAAYARPLLEIRRMQRADRPDAEIGSRARDLRRRIGRGQPLDSLLPAAFALVCDAVKLEIGVEPYDVQIVAGIALHQGKLAQMRTGEGKTLAAVFPAFLNGMTGSGVHIMTANDYLARRDAEWMGPVYRRLCVSVASIVEESSPSECRRAYAADITYLTAKQGGFDFLADDLRYSKSELVCRDRHMAIVDEADFILIDEARIPLVIAAEDQDRRMDLQRIDAFVRSLAPAVDFHEDRAGRNCALSMAGQRRVEEGFGCGGMHEEGARELYCAVHASLHAHRLLSRDVDYIVRNERIEIVDELTGRIADKRRWPWGIQSALEAKERVPVRAEGRIAGSTTIHHFIRQYPRLAAMTATAVPAAGELFDLYGLSTVLIPPNRPERTVHEPDAVFATRQAKLDAVVREVSAVHRTGRPVLVGTRTVKESEELAGLLRDAGVRCRVLNAKNDRREACLVARAGMAGAVTIATNMAGRGTDIKLGGEQGEERMKILALGGLYVIGTNRHDSVRVDNQLRGRAGRQGDPGSTQFFVSLEDDLFLRYGIREFIPERYRAIAGGGVISDRRVRREIDRAAEIIDGQNSSMRKTLHTYTELVEYERRALQELRRRALLDGELPRDVEERCTAELAAMGACIGPEPAWKALINCLLDSLDRFWAEHLEYIEELREGIHLQRYGGREPLLVFIREAGTAFEAGLSAAIEAACTTFEALPRNGDAAALLRASPSGPASTWTYLVNDNPFPAFTLSMVATGNIAAAAAAAAQFALLAPLIFAAGAARAAIAGLARLRRSRAAPDDRGQAPGASSSLNGG